MFLDVKFSFFKNSLTLIFRLMEWSPSFCSSARKVTVVHGLLIVCEGRNRVATMPTMATMPTINTLTAMGTLGQPIRPLPGATPIPRLPTVWLTQDSVRSANQLEMLELGVT